MNRPQHQIRLDNLERLIEEAGSAAALARIVNTSPSYISQVRSQRPSEKGTPRAIGDDLADRLERRMRKPSGWLDVERDDNVSKTATQEFAPSTCALLPLISWQQAQRQVPMKKNLANAQAPQFSCPIPCSDASYVLEVQGSSMEPIFHDGEYIFADPTLPPQANNFVIAYAKGANTAMLRQLVIDSGNEYLQALNPDWPNRIVKINKNISLHGVVIFRGGPV